MDKEYKTSVAQNVKRLAKIASKIEGSNPELSSELDNLNESYLSIMKEAQYVGVQGYAIRNKRCFDNCLRQKRASSDKPYDELWAECHEEYLNSMNNDSYDTWNKYASAEDKNVPNLQRELIKTADSLLDLSDKVEDPNDSAEIVAVANEIIREAQLGRWMGNLMGKLSPSIRNIRRNLEQLQNQLSNVAQQMETNQGNPQIAEKLKAGVLRGLQRYVRDFTTNPDYRSIVHPRAKAAIQQISQSLGQMQGQVQGADAASLGQVLQQAAQTTGQLIDFANKGIEVPSQEDKDQDGNPDIVDPNPNQPDASQAEQGADSDGDGQPDATDPDDNNDGVPDPTQADIATASSQVQQMFSQAKQYVSNLPKDPSFIDAVAQGLIAAGVVQKLPAARDSAAAMMGIQFGGGPEGQSGDKSDAGNMGGISMNPSTPMPGSGQMSFADSKRKRIY